MMALVLSSKKRCTTHVRSGEVRVSKLREGSKLKMMSDACSLWTALGV